MRANLDRRQFLAGTAAAAGLAASATPSFAAGIDWKRQKGATVSVLFQKSPRSDALAQYQKEFEELTGITVRFEAIPEQQARQKMVVEFASGSPSFDVVNVSLAVQKRLVGKGRWLTDLRPMLEPVKNDPQIDLADFGKGAVDFSTQRDGRLDTLPLNLDYWVLYYNKDLLAKAGLPYPETMTDLLKAAAKIHNPAENISGFVGRGLKNANTPVWTTFMLGWGQEVLDANGNLQTDNDKAVESAQLYTTLLSKFGPPGISGYNWSECQTNFIQGRVGFWLDGIGFAAPLENPQRSRVAGKVGYGVVPAGPSARHTAIFPDGMGIAEASKNKDAAFLYLMWALGKANQARMLKLGAGVPARVSPLGDADAMAGSPFGKEWADAMRVSAGIALPCLPQVQPVTEFRDIFGVALTNMLGGADIRSELKKATAEYKPILDQSEKS
jgi:multiple sugar transport system substrate-binding protein